MVIAEDFGAEKDEKSDRGEDPQGFSYQEDGGKSKKSAANCKRLLPDEITARMHELIGYIQMRLPHSLRSREEAEDVLQDALVSILSRKLERSRKPVQSPLAWVKKAVDNIIKEKARHLSRKKRRPEKAKLFSEYGGTKQSFIETAPSNSAPGSETFLTEEAVATIQELLDSLPSVEASMLRFLFFEGLEIREVAARSCISYAAASRRYRRALKHAREWFQKKAKENREEKRRELVTGSTSNPDSVIDHRQSRRPFIAPIQSLARGPLPKLT